MDNYNHQTHFKCPFCGRITAKSDSLIVPLRKFSHAVGYTEHYVIKYSFGCRECVQKNKRIGCLLTLLIVLLSIAIVLFSFVFLFDYGEYLWAFVSLILILLMNLGVSKLKKRNKITVEQEDAEACDSLVSVVEYEVYKDRVRT